MEGFGLGNYWKMIFPGFPGFLVQEIDHFSQGRRSQWKSAGAKGGTFFWSGFLLHFWAIWKNDPFSKFEKVPGLEFPDRTRYSNLIFSVFLHYSSLDFFALKTGLFRFFRFFAKNNDFCIKFRQKSTFSVKICYFGVYLLYFH